MFLINTEDKEVKVIFLNIKIAPKSIKQIGRSMKSRVMAILNNGWRRRKFEEQIKLELNFEKAEKVLSDSMKEDAIEEKIEEKIEEIEEAKDETIDALLDVVEDLELPEEVKEEIEEKVEEAIEEIAEEKIEEIIEEDFSEKTKKELVAICKERGLSSKGSKKDLIERLKA